MTESTEAFKQFIDTYFGGNSNLFDAMDIIDQECTSGRFEGRAYQDFVLNRWLIYLGSFEGFPTLIERFWWSVAFETAGMSFIEIVFKPYLQVMVGKYWEQFKNGFEESKNWGAISSNIKTAEEYLALIFAPPEIRPHTNDPVLQVLGVKTGGQLEALPYMEVNFRIAKMVVDGTFVKLHNAVCHDQQREVNRNDATGDRRIDKEKLERLYSERKKPSRHEKQISIDAQLEASGIIHKGYVYRDDRGEVIEAIDNNGQVDADEADARIRLIEQLKPRELDLFYAELERLHAKKTRDQWYGSDEAPKVTQQMKYLKGKYSSN